METNSQLKNKQPGIFSRILKFFWRLFLILLTGILLGGLLYFGFIQFYNNAVQNSQDSMAQVMVLKTNSAQQQLDNKQRLELLSARVAELEKIQGIQVEQISEMQGKLDQVERVLNQQRDMLQRLDQVEKVLDENSTADHDFQQQMTAEDGPLMALNRDVKILKTMTLITRARVNLEQNNSGLAAADIKQAYRILGQVKSETPQTDQTRVDAWLQRLALVLENLDVYPVMAADDLEIAWRLMADGLDELPEASVNETVVPPSFTPTSTPLNTATPTAMPLSLTATPTFTKTP
ncbi:MAG: hypothetical protein LWX83_15355 [Anaerolineae bacterium]|nr:hypothetical protein [Anaerolineae bacterium]